MCRKMGFPVRLVACVNTNDIVHQTFSAGNYRQVEMDGPCQAGVDYNY